VWRFAGQTLPATSVVVDYAGNVYSTGYDNKVFKINSTGTQVWEYALSTSGHSISVDTDSQVYVGLNNGNMIKLTSTGTLVWTNTDATGRRSAISTEPLVGAFPTAWAP